MFMHGLGSHVYAWYFVLMLHWVSCLCIGLVFMFMHDILFHVYAWYFVLMVWYICIHDSKGVGPLSANLLLGVYAGGRGEMWPCLQFAGISLILLLNTAVRFILKCCVNL